MNKDILGKEFDIGTKVLFAYKDYLYKGTIYCYNRDPVRSVIVQVDDSPLEETFAVSSRSIVVI